MEQAIILGHNFQPVGVSRKHPYPPPVTVSFGGHAATVLSSSEDRLRVRVPAAAEGTVDVTVTAVGGTSAAVPADWFTYYARPAVAGLSKTSGPTSGGTRLSITGTGFTGATAVSFGGAGSAAPAAFTVHSDTQITAVVPAHPAGAVHVYVTSNGGRNVGTATDRYTYRAMPSVTAVAPGSAVTAGGTKVVITGSGFTGVTAVHFGSATPAASFRVASDTRITAISPAHDPGAVNVRVRSSGGTSEAVPADRYRYTVAAPPRSGIAGEGRGRPST